MCSKPKVQTVEAAPPPPPAPTVVATDVSDGQSTQKATSAARKKKGYASTKNTGIETILGAVGSGGGLKNTLG